MRRYLAKLFLSHPFTLLHIGGKRSLAQDSLARRFSVWLRDASLKESLRFTAEDWDHIKTVKMRRIVALCAAQVRYYRKKFAKGHFSPSTFKSLDDMRRIPITKRMHLKKMPSKWLHVSGVHKYRKVEFQTSGSTGEPLHFSRDAFEMLFRSADVRHEYRLAGAQLSKPLLILGLPTHTWLDAWGERFSPGDIQDPVRRKKLYHYIESYKPRFLTSTPTLLLMFAENVRKDGFNASFEMIRYIGEHLDERGRVAIEKALNGTVRGYYGTKECGMIALECMRGSFHLVPWATHVEIVDDEHGYPLPMGNTGRVIVTSLENEVMPFVRYDIGDRGSLSEGCPCGFAAPKIEFSGRIGGTIDLNSEKKSFLEVNAYLSQFHEHLVRFQVEDRPGVVTLRFVASELFSPIVEKKLRAYFERILKSEKGFVLERVEVLEPQGDGKIPLFIKREG